MKTSVIIRRPALRAIVLSVCASGTCPRCRIVPDPTQSGRTKSKPFSKPKKRKLHFRCQRKTQFKSTPQKPRKVPPQNKPKVQQKPSKVLPKKAPPGAPAPRPPGRGNIVEGAFRPSRHRPNGPPTLFATLLQLCLQLCCKFVAGALQLCCKFVCNFVAGQGRGRQEEMFGRRCGCLLGGSRDF